MSQPCFLADEDLRGSIVQAIRRLEPDVNITTIVAQGQSSASDEEVLEYAWDNQWLLISHDVNTMKACAERRIAEGQSIHGLFLVPQNRSTRTVAESVMLIWSASACEEWRDRIVYLPL